MSEPVLPGLPGLSVHDLLRVPGEVLEELKRRGIIRGRSVVGDIGEYLAAAMYGVELPSRGTPGFDLICGGLRIQVKARVFDFGSDWSGAKFSNLGKGGFDAVLFLALDADTFEPTMAREVPFDRVAVLMDAKGRVDCRRTRSEGVDLLEGAQTAYRSL